MAIDTILHFRKTHHKNHMISIEILSRNLYLVLRLSINILCWVPWTFPNIFKIIFIENISTILALCLVSSSFSAGHKIDRSIEAPGEIVSHRNIYKCRNYIWVFKNLRICIRDKSNLTYRPRQPFIRISTNEDWQNFTIFSQFLIEIDIEKAGEGWSIRCKKIKSCTHILGQGFRRAANLVM